MKTKTERELITDIVTDPIGSYEMFHNRLKKDGQLASFPEFSAVVLFLIQELKGEYCENAIMSNPVLRYELQEVFTFLIHVNLTFEVTDVYPYDIPFDAPYPYRPTIDAIESAIRLLDKINRLDKNNKSVKLYHFDRYCYHRHALISNVDIILIPTTCELSMVDFIKTRAVPIEFIGVIPRTLRVDGHYQSPLDFWYHDFNHARRLYAYIKKSLKEKGIEKEEEIRNYYHTVNTFIENVIVKKCIFISDDTDEETRQIRLLTTMIIFEIVHETALTLERGSLIQDLLRPNGPQPFEYMKQNNESMDVETLRTPTGNVQSGASFRFGEVEKNIGVHYFLDKASIGLLANVYNKLTHFYYDDSGEVREDTVLIAYRNMPFLIRTVKYIFEVIGYDAIPTDEEIEALIIGNGDTKEKLFIKGINDDETSQFATEPMKADEAILLIKESNKKIFTLFGYSALGYERVDDIGVKIKEELMTLNKEEWIINIGATEEGIGFAYAIAKELGFTTMGVVSTQALSYSGRFSPYVDRIYIINDDFWGGFIPGTKKLADTTKVFLGVSDTISAYGGGENTAITLHEASILSIPIRFTEADMNHEKKDRVMLKKGEIKNNDTYRGEASSVWSQIR